MTGGLRGEFFSVQHAGSGALVREVKPSGIGLLQYKRGVAWWYLEVVRPVSRTQKCLASVAGDATRGMLLLDRWKFLINLSPFVCGPFGTEHLSCTLVPIYAQTYRYVGWMHVSTHKVIHGHYTPDVCMNSE